MKLAVALLAVVGMACALPAQRSGLKDDLDDFLALIPKEKFVELYHKYQNDPDVQRVVAYLKSADFAQVVHIIAGNDEVRDLVNYLEGQGVPVVDLLNRIADRLGLPHWPGYSSLPSRSSRSIRDFIDEAKALIPINEIAGLALDKLANSPAFQDLYTKISEVDYNKLHDAALSHPEITDLINRLNNLGVDTKKIWETIKSLFGWTYSSYNVYATKGLKDDLDDFLALIPKEKLVALYHKYENDPDVKRIVAYLKSSEFAQVVHIIAGVDEIRDLVNYLEGQGVPVVDLLNRIADRLGLPHWTGYSGLPSRSSRSIRDIIDEVKALIPINEIAGLALDKLANSPAFQDLYTKISEVDYNKLHDAALSHPEITDLINRLNNLGVDTKKIWETIKSLFGWTYSSYKVYATKGLKDDLDDFLALIPKEKLVALYHKYENDPDVKRIVAYLKSAEFGQVVHIIAGVDEVRDLVNYLEGQGVPVVDLLNRIADRLGLPHWTGYSSLPSRSSRSIRDIIDEVKALIPINEIAGLALDKLANSPAFQDLYTKISEVDYNKLHDAALSHPEITDLINRLNNLGVDTKKIWDTIKSLFGWTYSSYNVYATKGLKDDLDDFLALIPKEKLVALYHKYENDPDVKRIVAYLKSAEFGQVVHIIAGVDEVRDLVNYLEGQGVPVVDLLNRIADRLGLPHWTGYSGLPVRSSRAIRDIIDEVKALIPINEIAGLALDKLANSPAFQDLYTKISEVDYNKLHDAALSHPEITDLINRLNNLGVDTKKIWETIKMLFGWTY